MTQDIQVGTASGHYCQASSFTSVMYFLVLLSALLACAAAKCYSYSNVMLDGPVIQDIYIYMCVCVCVCVCVYGLSKLEQSTEKTCFSYSQKIPSPLWRSKISFTFSQKLTNCLHHEPDQLSDHLRLFLQRKLLFFASPVELYLYDRRQHYMSSNTGQT